MLLKVIPKYQNPQVSNLAIIHNDTWSNSALMNIGAVRNPSNSYYNVRYRNSIYPDLYYKSHYEIPMPLIYRLSTNNTKSLRSKLQDIDWDENAKDREFQNYGHYWSNHGRNRLLELRCSGMLFRKISKVMGRTNAAVRAEYGRIRRGEVHVDIELRDWELFRKALPLGLLKPSTTNKETK